jgi:hypothetical protein
MKNKIFNGLLIGFLIIAVGAACQGQWQASSTFSFLSMIAGMQVRL